MHNTDDATDKKKNHLPRNKRHMARRLAIQALYQYHFHPQPCLDLMATVSANTESRYSKSYFETILSGTLEHIKIIDQHITQASSRQLATLTPIECAVLRLAIFEWLHCPDVPAKVILNEALELAKEFGAQDGYKYVNGVLNNLLPTLRPQE